MGERNFTTHMLKAFLEKYGDVLQEYFINDALVGRYMSAGDLYNYIYPDAKEENHYERINKNGAIQDDEVNAVEEEYGERTSPKQPKFNKKYLWIVNFINKVLKARIPDRISLVGSFFDGNFVEVGFPKESENAYWENLFAYAWLNLLDEEIKFSRVYFEENKDDIVGGIDDIIGEIDWYKESLWKNILWSIELFRLRVFFDTIKEKSFDFVYLLDWIDIFEYRIVPNVLERVMTEIFEEYFDSQGTNVFTKRTMLAKLRNDIAGKRIYEYFVRCIDNLIDFPYAERFGLSKKQKRDVVLIRKQMLPLKGLSSDVNMEKDGEIYYKLVELLKSKIGQVNNASAVHEGIRDIVNERNSLRNNLYNNGSSYSFLSSRNEIEKADTDFIDCSVKLFAALTTDVDVTDTETIFANLLIYHMLQSELTQQESDDLHHPLREQQKEQLENLYAIYRRDVLTQIFQEYTNSKRLQMAVALEDITDDLLAEMLMLGSSQLVKDESDNILEELFSKAPSMMDEKRNQYINQTWSTFDAESRMLYALCPTGRLERIRGYITEDMLSVDEKAYVNCISVNWKKEIIKIHELLQSLKRR